MKSDWERDAPVLAPPREAVIALLARERPGARLAGVEPLPGGLANTNLRLRLEPATDLVLRLYQRDAAARPKEVALAARLAGLVPVPEVVATGDGEGLGAWTLVRWVDGEPMDALVAAGREAELAAAAEHAGQLLARLGEVRFAKPGILGADACGGLCVAEPLPLSTAAYRAWLELALEAARLPAGLAAGVRALAEAAAGRLDGPGADRALVHCDYNGANLLVREGRVVAVLDWEFAMCGTPLWDAGNMLRHFAATPAFDAAFEAGMRAGGLALPPGWRALAALLDIVNLADMLSRSPAGSRREASMIRSIEAHLEASSNDRR